MPLPGILVQKWTKLRDWSLNSLTSMSQSSTFTIMPWGIPLQEFPLRNHFAVFSKQHLFFLTLPHARHMFYSNSFLHCGSNSFMNVFLPATTLDFLSSGIISVLYCLSLYFCYSFPFVIIFCYDLCFLFCSPLSLVPKWPFLEWLLAIKKKKEKEFHAWENLFQNIAIIHRYEWWSVSRRDLFNFPPSQIWHEIILLWGAKHEWRFMHNHHKKCLILLAFPFWGTSGTKQKA